MIRSPLFTLSMYENWIQSFIYLFIYLFLMEVEEDLLISVSAITPPVAVVHDVQENNRVQRL